MQFMNICQLAPIKSHGGLVQCLMIMLTVNNFDINQIRSNTIVLDKADNWNELLFKEVLLIKSHKPSLNTALKISKELQLFQFKSTDIIQRIFEYHFNSFLIVFLAPFIFFLATLNRFSLVNFSSICLTVTYSLFYTHLYWRWICNKIENITDFYCTYLFTWILG